MTFASVFLWILWTRLATMENAASGMAGTQLASGSDLASVLPWFALVQHGVSIAGLRIPLCRVPRDQHHHTFMLDTRNNHGEL